METKLTDGKINLKGNFVARQKPKFADYLLYLAPNHPIAVIEAKDNNHSVSHGLQQAMTYAQMLDLPFAYSSNGDGFAEHDFLTGTVRQFGMDEFPTEAELIDRYKQESGMTPQQETVVNQPYYSSQNTYPPRYYQRIAINRTVDAIAKGQDRLLLVMATGTGKTYTAFQIVYRMLQSGLKKKILYLADRNILVDQSIQQDFAPLEKVIHKINVSKDDPSTITSHQVYFSLYQQLVGDEGEEHFSKLFKPDFFDLIMYNLMKAGTIVPAQANLADKIYKTYLIDEWQEDETRIKLKPVKNDQKAFGMLFKEEEDYIRESNLTINYNFFCSQIQKELISIDELYTAITRLEIINITLNHDDNPQLIFESLNSTGLALSEGDKIRNFILMGLPTKEQNTFYENYWNKIEVCTAYDVSAFIRDYLSVKQQAIPAMSKVYTTFKSYVEEGNIETEPLLSDMLAYAKRYQTLLRGKTQDKKLNACIDRLNRLETTITRPFFLEVLRLQEEAVLTLDEVRKIFQITESYLFRRTICDLPTNALNKIFLMLHREIIRFDGSSSEYVNKFIYALLSKNERGRFPRNAEFIEAFSTRQIYQMNGKNKIYIFERIENDGTLEDKDIYRHCDEGVYTIEHIMPQHLTPAWTEALGSEWVNVSFRFFASAGRRKMREWKQRRKQGNIVSL